MVLYRLQVPHAVVIFINRGFFSMSNSKIILIVAILISFVSGFFVGKNKYHDNSIFDETDIYATFNGGEVSGKEVRNHIQQDILNYPLYVYGLKKNRTLELARERILNAEALKRKVGVNDLISVVQNEHQNDPIDPKEFTHFVVSQGLNEKKLTKIERDNFNNLLRQRRMMEFGRNALDEIVKSANLQLLIPEVK
jgi:hypothetical protein